MASSHFEIYVWRKLAYTKVLEPIWVANQSNIFTGFSSFDDFGPRFGFSNFTCSQNGDFIICYVRFLVWKISIINYIKPLVDFDIKAF